MRLHPGLPALCLLALLPRVARAPNPLSTSAGFGGVADPHVHVFNNTFYLYSTHDLSPEDRGFVDEDWRVFSSPDLLEWTLAATVLPSQTPAAPADYKTCWATDAAFRYPFFYFYLSLGSQQIGVLRGAGPAGPWEDPLGAPLVNASYGRALGTEARDPGVFADDDGKFYLVFGTFNYYIAELAADMVSFAAPPAPVVVVNATSQNGVGVLDDKPFLHKRAGRYYFSYGGFYGISDSVRGPFQHVGTWLDRALIAPDFRINGTSGPCWCQAADYNDRHGSFFSAGGQDFWSSNDRSHSADPFNTNAFRDTILTYVHYQSDGAIAPVVINATGVGAYDARHYLEAENFFSLRGAGRKWHEPGGSRFAVTGLAPASALAFPHVRGAARAVALSIHAAADGAAPVRAARAVLFAGQAQLCAADLAGAREGAWADFKCVLEPAWPGEVGSEDLHLTLTLAGQEAAAVLIDRINFLF